MNISVLLLIFISILAITVMLSYRGIFSWLDDYFYRKLRVQEYNLGHPYAQGNFAPIHNEMTCVEAEVIGTIPPDLSGEYLRNGTNQRHQPSGRMHMFDGAGMIHQIRIADGKAWYSNTYIRTPKFKFNEQNGRDCFTHVGDLAGGGLVGMGKVICELIKKQIGLLPRLNQLESSSGSTSLLFHHNKLYALQEISYPFALDVSVDDKQALILSGEGHFERFDNHLDAPFSAHVKIDPDTQDVIFFSNSIDQGQIFYAELSKEGHLKTLRPVQKNSPCNGFIHDIFITKHFAICPDMSLRFDVKKMGSLNKSPWFFDTNTHLKFGVMRRKPDTNGRLSYDLQWFNTKQPGFIWHTINAWEESRSDGGTDLILLAPMFDHYPSTIPIHLPEEPKASTWLWRLNLESGEITEQRKVIERFFERPTINDKYMGKKHRFAYLLDKSHPRGMLGCGVQKYDLLREEYLEYFSYGDDFGGEPLFVAQKHAQSEDDGYILELLMNEQHASLVILAAKDLSLYATIKIPQRIPFGVHSLWIPAQELHLNCGSDCPV